jgi:hypothetical protein
MTKLACKLVYMQIYESRGLRKEIKLANWAGMLHNGNWIRDPLGSIFGGDIEINPSYLGR